MFSLNLVWILCVIFLSPGTSLPEKLFDRAFAVIWNAPSGVCENHLGITFNFDHYNIIQNTGDHFQGDKMVIFYERQLGMYPFILPNGTHINGGIPQVSYTLLSFIRFSPWTALLKGASNGSQLGST